MMNKRYNLNARVLSNTARAFADRLQNEKRVTIDQILTGWNNILVRGNHSGCGDVQDYVLTGNYKRKAVLVMSLTLIADQLFEMAQCRDTVYDIEEAHAEALEEEEFQRQIELTQARAELLAHIEADHAEGEAVVAAINTDIAAGIAHAEALAINAAYNTQIAFQCVNPAYQRNLINWAHEDALQVNKAMDAAAARAAGLNEEWVAKVAAGEVSLAEALGDMDTDAECAAMEVSPAMHRYLLWLGRAKENGLKLVAWNCPACNVQLQGVYPSNDREEWDSHTMCPACNHLYFKITRYGENGAGSVELIEV